MKILNNEEIKALAYCLSMTQEQAQEVADLFVRLFNEQKKQRGWKIELSLDDCDDYIREWENHWHREFSWQEAYEEEKLYIDEYEDKSIFNSIDDFRYNCENITHYELPKSKMIAVVC